VDGNPQPVSSGAQASELTSHSAEKLTAGRFCPMQCLVMHFSNLDT